MNQKSMKVINKQKVFRAIVDSPGISRASIAKQCRYSKTTVSGLVEELISSGFVTDLGLSEDEASGLGRKPNRLYIDRDIYGILVVNCHKRYLQIAYTDMTGTVKMEVTLQPDQKIEPQIFLVENVQTFLAAISPQVHILAGCIILPAMILEKEDLIISEVLPGIITDHLISYLCKAFPNIPLHFLNDTACLAYEEKFNVHKKDNNDFVYINMNNGIGAVFVINGTLLGGPDGVTTQFGSFSLQKENNVLQKNGLEKRIGEQALSDRIKECGAENSLSDSPILFKHIGEQAKRGNSAALDVIDVLAEDLGYALGNLITILRVDHVIIGGFGCNLGDVFLNKVKEYTSRTGFLPFTRNVEITYSDMDNDALLRGASKYYIDNFFDFVL